MVLSASTGRPTCPWWLFVNVDSNVCSAPHDNTLHVEHVGVDE